MKNFALIGAAGFVAPKHLKAIKDNGGELLCALDKHDSVGILDSYFPEAHFFTEFERFDRHVEKLKRKKNKIDYVSICTPNYLHDAHIRFALRVGAQAICEKPLVLNPWNLDALNEVEEESRVKINTILQLRLHPNVIALKKEIEASTKKHEVELTYITSRGKWYGISWKGDENRSGGVTTNIGIHFFDMLLWIFGDCKKNEVHINQPQKASGFLELEKANVKWFLSVDAGDLPKNSNQRMYRKIVMEDKEIDLSEGFEDLHTLSYRRILEGKGFGLKEARASIELVHQIRHSQLVNKS